MAARLIAHYCIARHIIVDFSTPRRESYALFNRECLVRLADKTVTCISCCPNNGHE